MAEFHFLRPYWLACLIPLIPFALWLLRRRLAQSPWSGLIDAHLLRHLLVDGGGAWSRLPLGLIIAGWLIGVLALAGPTWSKLPAFTFRPATPPLVLVLDLSRSMGAVDLRPSRLAVARTKIRGLLERMQPREVGLVVFSGREHTVMPLTEDAGIIETILPFLHIKMMPSPGSAAAPGLLRADDLIRRAGYAKGDVVLISDGAGQPAVDAAGRLSGGGVRVSVLAVGTVGGGPIPIKGGDYLTHDGETVRPPLGEGPLRAVAKAGGGSYAVTTASDADVSRLLSSIQAFGLAGGGEENKLAEMWKDRGAWLVLLLLPLAAVAFRRGWLGAVIVVMALQGSEARAAEGQDLWQDLWQRPDQRALHALRQGAARYRAGDYESAAATFSALGHPYNLGNALVQSGRLEEALAAYDKALSLDPAHADARHNRDLVQAALDKTTPPPAGKKTGSGGGNKSSQTKKDGGKDQSGQPGGLGKDGKDGDGDANRAEAIPVPPKDDGKKTTQGDPRSSKPGQAEEREDEPVGRQLPTGLESEYLQAMEQWLARIPDDPGGLLQEKFRREYERDRGAPPWSRLW